MKSEYILSTRQNRLAYLLFVSFGLLMLILTRDAGWTGIFLALALVFNPFPETTFRELSLLKKSAILLQTVLALFLMGLSFYQTIG